MNFVRRPGFLRAVGFLLGFAGMSNMIGLPWAFTANDFTIHGLLLNGGLLVLPGIALMRLAESLDRKRARVPSPKPPLPQNGIYPSSPTRSGNGTLKVG